MMKDHGKTIRKKWLCTKLLYYSTYIYKTDHFLKQKVKNIDVLIDSVSLNELLLNVLRIKMTKLAIT